MLESMRKFADSIFIKILLGFLVVVFVVWGVGDVFRNNTSVFAAKVGNIAISQAELDNSVQAELAAYQRSTGQSITSEQAEKLGLKRLVLEQLINAKLLKIRAKDLGIDVSDDIIKKRIISNSVFKDEAGKFSKDRFKSILAQNGFSENDYVNLLRQEMSVAIVMNAISAMPDDFSKISLQLYRARNESRVVDLVSIPDSLVSNVEEPSDADVMKYYEKNTANFTLPELRSVSYVKFSSDSVVKNAKISEEDLQKEYDVRKDEFKVEETRDIDQYVFDSEEKANQAYALLSKGKSIKDKKNSLVNLQKDTIPENIASVVFNSPVGIYSKPLKTSLGWHVFNVTKITPPRSRSFAEMRTQIEKELLENKNSEAVEAFLTKIEDEIASGTKLEEIAAKYKFSVNKISNIRRDGKDKSGDVVSSTPDPEIFLPLVFDSEKSAVSSVVTLADGKNYVIARVDEINVSRVQAIDEVKGSLIEAWKVDKKNDKLKEMAMQAMQNIKNGKAVGIASAKIGANTEIKKNNISLPSVLVQDIFTLAKDGVTFPYRAKNGDYIFAKLVKVNPAKSPSKGEIDEINEELKSTFMNDIMVQYVQYLRKIYPIEIMQDKG